MKRLLLATRNLHKVREISTILGGKFECLSLRDFPGAPEVTEDSESFEGNARKKAETLADWLQNTQFKNAGGSEMVSGVLADDSGLEVDALQGAPGVHSARFASQGLRSAGNSTDADNNAKLLHLLKRVPMQQRRARFRCVIALVLLQSPSSTPSVQCFEGICEGRIGFEAWGKGGFGYDPLFMPEGFKETLAELGEATKNRISHRAKALERLKLALA